jgi:hypothetical protein
MSLDYVRKTTSAEVWAVIRARHHVDMTVFSSYSAPDGNPDGDLDKCEMMTEYGFNGDEVPLIGCRTTWTKKRDSYERLDEIHHYWLCVARETLDF